MSRHRAAILLVTGAVAVSTMGVGAAAAATFVSPPSKGAEYRVAVQPQRAQTGARSATLHTAKVTINGKVETILENSHNLPLYYYKLDTATRSLVSDGLAQFWPPLISTSPTEIGAHGKLSVLKDADGHQVAYNGHFLYTFSEDSPGQVKGQGVEDFFVATPNLKNAAGAPTSKVMVPTTSGGYTVPTTAVPTTPTTISGYRY